MRFHLNIIWMPLDCQWDATWLNLMPLSRHYHDVLPLSFHLTFDLRPFNFQFDSTWLQMRWYLNVNQMPLDCWSDANRLPIIDWLSRIIDQLRKIKYWLSEIVDWLNENIDWLIDIVDWLSQIIDALNRIKDSLILWFIDWVRC